MKQRAEAAFATADTSRDVRQSVRAATRHRAAHDHAEGRTLYSSLAPDHAYLEFPVLMALTVAWATRLGRSPESVWMTP